MKTPAVTSARNSITRQRPSCRLKWTKRSGRSAWWRQSISATASSEPFAFRINSETLPELVEPYQPRKRGAGRPAKGPFDPARDIPEDVHRAALDAVFAEGSIGSYREYQERLKEGYERQGVKFGGNRATQVAAFLREQQMVIREGNAYRLNPRPPDLIPTLLYCQGVYIE